MRFVCELDCGCVFVSVCMTLLGPYCFVCEHVVLTDADLMERSSVQIQMKWRNEDE